MRRLVLIVPAVAAAAALAGCGAQGVVSPTPQTVIGSTPQAAQDPATPALKVKGDPTAGKGIFTSAGCTSCHTLAAVGSTGTVGPNLDDAKPSYRRATARVTLGKGVMPSFKGQLSTQEIANVASFVVKATGGTP